MFYSIDWKTELGIPQVESGQIFVLKKATVLYRESVSVQKGEYTFELHKPFTASFCRLRGYMCFIGKSEKYIIEQNHNLS